MPAASGAAAETAASVADPSAYVNPFVGTTNAGNTHPGAVAPFGMFSWGPDATFYNGPANGSGTMRSVSPSGYEYNSPRTRGFGLTHVSGAGCAGLSGDVPIMPIVGNVTTSPSLADTQGSSIYSSNFSHNAEEASPGAYSVLLDNGVDVDLAASTRTGSGVFTYPAGQPASMLVRSSDSLMGSEDADVSIDTANQKITGSVRSGNFCGSFVGDGSLRRSYYTLHYTITFDKPFAAVGTWEDANLSEGMTTASGGTGYTGGKDGSGNPANGYPPAGKGSGAYVTFDTSSGSSVKARVAISYVSLANAEENLETESPAGTTIANVKADTKAAWNTELGRVDLTGGTEAERTVFYTAMYHSLLHPNVFSDVNREYWGFDQQKHTVPAGQDAQYATFSGWDVYRSQVQLVTLLDPKRGSDIAASLLNQAKQNNDVWDRWTHVSGATHVMVGDPSAISVAGIVAFGGTDFPVEEAYDSLADAARVPTADDLSRTGWNIGVIGQRPSLDQLLEHHYYPSGCNAWACANETLEMSAADYGLATLADHLGKPADYTEFAARSQYWQNQFNPNALGQDGYRGYFQNRAADGSWASGFNSASGAGFVEGTAAQYVWLVQHNMAGLYDAMGGRENAVDRLDKYFKDANGNFVLTGSWDNNIHANVDNEPSIATPWLYNYAGAPWKTQETVRAALQTLWLDKSGPSSIPGNDDLGAMSSWLVFSALGVFPQNPSRAELTVAAPLFPSAVITRANGTTLTINAPGATADTTYIQSMKIDGAPTTHTYLDASAITQDTTVDFVVDTTPNTSWGTAVNDAPPSDRTGEQTYVTSIAPQTVTAPPSGHTSDITVTASRLGVAGADTVTYTVDTPAGLTANPAAGTLEPTDLAAALAASFRVRASASVAEGTYPVTVHVASNGEPLGDVSVDVVVAPQFTTLFASSIEANQPQPTANDHLDSTNWGEFCCSLGGLETSSHAERAHTGATSIVYSGRATGPGAAATNRLFSGRPEFATPIAADTQLTYWVYPQGSGAPFSYITNVSQFVALDLLFTDNTRLSTTGAIASNGAAIDAFSQGAVLTPDSWNEVTVTLPASATGKTIASILLSASSGDTYATDGIDDGYARGWFDDIRISAPTTPMSVTAMTGVTARQDRSFTADLATFVNGSGTTASDFTATVDWGDGSAASSATVRSDGDHYVVTGTHSYPNVGTEHAVITVEDIDGVPATGTTDIEVQPLDALPYITGATPTSVAMVTGGRSPVVTLTAERTESNVTDDVSYTITAPTGLTPSAASGTLEETDTAGSLASAVTFRAATDLASGTYPVTVSFESGATALDDVHLDVVVSSRTGEVFFSGLESGEPQLTGDNLQLDTPVEFTGFCCGLTGAESKRHATGVDVAVNTHSGLNSIVYSGRAIGPNAHAANTLFQDVLAGPVTPGASLGYWVFPQTVDGPSVGGETFNQNASPFVALDLVFDDGSRLSETGAIASNGAPIDALSQGDVLTKDAWNHVTVALPASTVGKRISQVIISFSTGSTYGSTSNNEGYLRGWIDDVSISGENDAAQVTPLTGITGTVGEEISGTIAHVSGGEGSDASSYSATILWGDGSAVEDATIVSDGTGYAIQGAHTYAQPGTYSAKVIAEDADGVRTPEATVSIIVSPVPVPDPVELVGASGLTAVVAQKFDGTLATFTERDGDAANGFTADVDWGDGSATSAGNVAADSGTFTIGGTHAYATAGTYNVTVALTELSTSLISHITVPIMVTAGVPDAVQAAMTATVAKTRYNKRAKVVVNVTAAGTTPTGTITVTRGAKKLATGTLVNGKVTLKLKKTLKPKKQKLIVTFAPDATSNVTAPAPVHLTLKVKKALAKIKITKAKRLTVGKKATITVRVKPVGKAKPKKTKVTIKVGKKSFGKAKVKKRGGKWIAVVHTKKLTKTGKVKVKFSGTKKLAKRTVKTNKRVRR